MEVKQETRLASQDELPQEIDDPLRTDPERVEEAAQAIRQIVKSASSQFWEANVQATKPKSRLVRTITFFASTWVVFFAIISAFTVLVGWYEYEVRPLHSVERIAREQKQADAEKEMGDYYVDLGNKLLNVGEAKAARAQFKEALDLDPLNVEAQMGDLKCELFESVEQEHFDLAIIQPKLNKLANERPGDTHVYAFRGTVNYLAYKPDRALWNYKRAVSYEDSNAYAYDGMATIYYEKGEFDKSVEMSKRAHDIAPRNPTYKHNYANALYASGNDEEAIRQYKGVTLLDVQFIWAYHDLGQLYRLTGKLRRSQWYYEQFIDLLEDEEVRSLEKNQGGAGFTTGSDSYPVYLAETPEQRYYAYYSIALTAYLRGHTEEAASYVSKAEDIQIDPYIESEIKRLMEYDITLLKEKQKQFEARADGFRSTFL